MSTKGGTLMAPAGPAGPDGARPPRADARRNRARILAAAEELFEERGAAASTEEVARRAGVAAGTVFRHFPTKDALLGAIMKELMRRLAAEVDELVERGDPATALFAFFTRMAEQAAAKRGVVESLAAAGVDIQLTRSVDAFGASVAALLDRAQRAGAVRPQVRPDEVTALLTGVCQGALHGGWDADLRARTLELVFAGLRPAAGRPAR
ncbi:TetR/AcrR family transcriptional regulator [Allonocardiopsis opalescens]|uniref:TetR/AcrR family transcriptional regulator n=1 Tax=Allonocardiopsis opalescens TaxID=1144618 RepID=UPI001FEAED50|nr:TetR/AcrR family transcriptional regulator [Allonocardiopsis opalescens]